MFKKLFSNVDKKDSNGFTPLFRACRDGDIASIKLCLEQGANVNVVENWYGHTPLSWVCDDYIGIGDKRPNLASSKRLEIAKLLIKNGAAVNHKSQIGYTPLKNVCNRSSEDYLELIKVLIENGADLKFADISYKLLDYNLGTNQQIVDLALNNGADINQQNEKGETLLSEAFQLSDVNRIDLILQKGACQKNKYGTLLPQACSLTHAGSALCITELLIQYGAELIGIKSIHEEVNDLLNSFNNGLNPHAIAKLASIEEAKKQAQAYLQLFITPEKQNNALLRFIRYTLNTYEVNEVLCRFLIKDYLSKNSYSQPALQKLQDFQVPKNVLSKVGEEIKSNAILHEPNFASNKIAFDRSPILTFLDTVQTNNQEIKQLNLTVSQYKQRLSQYIEDQTQRIAHDLEPEFKKHLSQSKVELTEQKLQFIQDFKGKLEENDNYSKLTGEVKNFKSAVRFFHRDTGILWDIINMWRDTQSYKDLVKIVDENNNLRI
jgi:ankyrin repeat protein